MVSNMFIFHNIWDNPSHWLICFKMVKTTNNFPSESFVVSVPSLGLEGVLPSLQKPSSKSQAAMESTTRVHSALHLRGSRGRVATRGHRRHQNASDAGDLTYLLKMNGPHHDIYLLWIWWVCNILHSYVKWPEGSRGSHLKKIAKLFRAGWSNHVILGLAGGWCWWMIPVSIRPYCCWVKPSVWRPKIRWGWHNSYPKLIKNSVDPNYERELHSGNIKKICNHFIECHVCIYLLVKSPKFFHRFFKW